MRPGQFYFNGINSLDYDMVIQHRPKRVSPTHNFASVTASNRDGFIYHDDQTYSNGNLTLEIVFLNPHGASQTEMIDEIFDVTGYVYFTPYYDESHTYKVMVEKAPEYENTKSMRRAVTFELSLSVYPFKYIASALDTIKVAQAITLVNPTKYIAKPVIKLFGTGNKTLTINEAQYQINGISGSVEVDSEKLELLGAGELMGLDFPVFSAGTNAITTTADRMEIIPRFYRKAV